MKVMGKHSQHTVDENIQIYTELCGRQVVFTKLKNCMYHSMK